MKYTISPDRSKLTITADELERAELRELGEDVHRDRTMHDWLEPLTCNSELEWIDPSETGDLTSAPMLGYHGCGISVPPDKVACRWAFLDYAVRSVLEDLRDKGECVFVGGDL